VTDSAARPATARPVHWWLLAGLVAAVLISNALWLHADRRPTDMDQGRYMMMVEDFADGWQSPDLDFVASFWRGNHPTHPHVVPLLASAAFSVTGRNVDAAYFVNSLFLAGLVVLVFLLGLRQRDAACGLLAATLTAGLPLLSRFSRFFLLEEAAAFFVVAALYCLLRTRRFSHLGWSLALGLAVGFGLLTKWTTLVFVAPPILLLGVLALVGQRRAAPLWKLAAAAAGTLLVAAPWYYTHWLRLRDFYSYNEEGLLFAGDGPGWGQLWYYLNTFWANAGWPYALLAILGLGYLAWRRDGERQALLLAILVPLLTFSFLISTRDLRHLLPAFPLLLAAAAIAVRSLPVPTPWRKGFTAAAAALALVSAFHSAWGLTGGDEPIYVGSPSALLLPEARPPDRQDWRFGELLDRIAADAGAGEAPVRVRMIPGNLPFRPNAFVFLAAERYPRFKIQHVSFYIPTGRPKHRHLGALDLLNSSYMLTRGGDVNGNRNGMFHYARAMQQYLARSRSAGELFVPIHTTELPSRHAAHILRVEQFRCNAALFDFLDWAHQTDPDDPSIGRVVEGCIERTGPRGQVWQALPELLALASADRPADLTRLRDMAARHPEVRWLQRLLADALRAAGDLPQAAAAYAGLGMGAPYLCSPFLSAGECWLDAGMRPAARDALERAIEDTPDCLQVHRRLAALLGELGETKAARREEAKVGLLLNQEALGPRADTARYRLRLGNLALAAGQLAEARHHYEAGLRNEPGHGELRRRLRALDNEVEATREERGSDER